LQLETRWLSCGVTLVIATSRVPPPIASAPVWCRDRRLV
jgi:hypothetical protein